MAAAWAQLAQLLSLLHKRDIIVRDVQPGNAVRAKTGSTRCWTLLEFAAVTRSGAMAASVTAATAPPEVRCAQPPFAQRCTDPAALACFAQVILDYFAVHSVHKAQKVMAVWQSIKAVLHRTCGDAQTKCHLLRAARVRGCGGPTSRNHARL